MLCIAENMSTLDRRRHFNTLLLQFEAYLKKLYYLCTNKEVSSKDPDKAPTLSDAIFAIDSIKALKHDARPQHQAFSQKLTLLRQLRNDEAHQSQEASEQEVIAFAAAKWGNPQNYVAQGALNMSVAQITESAYAIYLKSIIRSVNERIELKKAVNKEL